MCGAGCAERKNKRGRKRGKRERRIPKRTKRTSLVIEAIPGMKS